jgi:hypothetical protein
MEIRTTRAMLLAVAAALVVSWGLATATAALAGLEASHNPNCRSVVDPVGVCEADSCKASCTLKYGGEGVCVDQPLGCQCDYCPKGVPGPPARRMIMHGR